MNATPGKPSDGRRLASRGRTLFSAALLGVACLVAVGLAALVWLRPPPPSPPAIDLSGADPAVAHAIEEARQMVEQAPRSASAWGRLGMVLLAHGYRNEARACFTRAQQLDPREPRWPYYLGTILSLDEPTAAAPQWRRAAELFGSQAMVARLHLSEALLEQGSVDEAEKELKRVLDADPDNPHALLLLGRVEYARGAFAESLDHLALAAQAPSVRKSALAASAVVRRRIGEADAAAKDLQLARDLPDDPPMPDPLMAEVGQLQRGKQALLRRAEDALGAGRIPEAVGWFRELVQEYPDTDWAWLRLGRALLQEGDYPGAEQALRTSLERTPDLVEAHFYLGVVRYQRGDYRMAAAAFRRAAELKPDHALAQFNLGHALLQIHDRDGARQAFRAALESKPAFSDAHAELAQLLAGDGLDADAAAEAREALRLDAANEKARQVLDELAKRGRPE